MATTRRGFFSQAVGAVAAGLSVAGLLNSQKREGFVSEEFGECAYSKVSNHRNFSPEPFAKMDPSDAQEVKFVSISGDAWCQR